MTNRTMKYDSENNNQNQAKDIILNVYEALLDKGYNPINQLVGYFISGDPTYITSHKDARNMIKHIDRDEVLEVLLKYYINNQS